MSRLWVGAGLSYCEMPRQCLRTAIFSSQDPEQSEEGENVRGGPMRVSGSEGVRRVSVWRGCLVWKGSPEKRRHPSGAGASLAWGLRAPAG